MKKYINPITTVTTVATTQIICASGETKVAGFKPGTVTNTTGL